MVTKTEHCIALEAQQEESSTLKQRIAGQIAETGEIKAEIQTTGNRQEKLLKGIF